jgi:hypothetical protein
MIKIIKLIVYSILYFIDAFFLVIIINYALKIKKLFLILFF